PGRAAEARGSEDGHRLGPPDSQLCSRPVEDQGSAHQLRGRQYAGGARRQPRRLYRGELEAGGLMSKKEGKTSPDTPGPQDESQVIAERRAKLKALRDRGQAYPNDFRRDTLAADLHEAHDAKSASELEQAQVEVAIAGRMLLKRVMGKASF